MLHNIEKNSPLKPASIKLRHKFGDKDMATGLDLSGIPQFSPYDAYVAIVLVNGHLSNR